MDGERSSVRTGPRRCITRCSGTVAVADRVITCTYPSERRVAPEAQRERGADAAALEGVLDQQADLAAVVVGGGVLGAAERDHALLALDDERQRGAEQLDQVVQRGRAPAGAVALQQRARRAAAVQGGDAGEVGRAGAAHDQAGAAGLQRLGRRPWRTRSATTRSETG